MKYLNGVTGQQIVEEHDKLQTATTFVIAVQPFPLKDVEGKPLIRNDLPIYDTFVYFKELAEGRA
ncbi:MAG: hypothetical protein HY376_02880 [Candidatus Blackburnbacteria bacterium]|nr:hypothetical protein [Candidatus Blackburnbacteria bacterium]